MITKTFLKTVSAFSNYNDGKIIFGINDNAEVVGLEVTDEMCLRIEHMINDSIDPVPSYELEIESFQDKQIIILSVQKGTDTPYYYQGKAYRRSNTSTVEVDRLELNRLILAGIQINYESMKSSEQDLDFTILEKELISKVGIGNISIDILKTLNLYDKNGFYNIAGKLLADKNDIDHSGIDIVKFGKDINLILYRTTLNKTSLLKQYYEAIEIFERYYQYEKIEGYQRIEKDLVPREAFRESIANAIVHRVWDIEAQIKIAMYEDRIEIDSPGGLPAGMSKAEYINGNVSLLRNPIIAGVFYRLKIIEKFGTGIPRIINQYKDSITKPNFEISDNNIRITLPLIEKELLNLAEEEIVVYNLLHNKGDLYRSEIEKATGYNKSKMIRVINKLIDRNVVEKLGIGPKTTYTIK
ncbi:MAG: AAA family ATPase [Spirochaetia bacterium]|nr:AAA family ATPase [Spirochaetia bacterium]